MPSFNIKVESNARDVALLLDDIGERIIDQAKVGAINKTLTQSRTAVRREVSKETGVPARILSRRVRIGRARKARPVGRLFFGTYNVPVKELDAKQTRKGITRKGPGGRRVTEPGAFFATMSSGHQDFFRRKGGAGRLPIERVVVNIIQPARRAMNNAALKMPIIFRRLWNSDFQFRVSRAIDSRRLRE
jgi:hypothetical protein